MIHSKRRELVARSEAGATGDCTVAKQTKSALI